MQPQLIAGNWKMNGLVSDGKALAADLLALQQGQDGVNAALLLCPPAPLLPLIGDILRDSPIQLGGQDCHAKASGAHTGDTSAQLLADIGCSHVIVGHSERRADHGESSAEVQDKAMAAMAAGLTPIICVGETEGERDAGRALAVIGDQIAQSLPDGAGPERTGFVVAYEPVWAIGTGRTATPGDVAEVHTHIFGLLSARFGAGAAQETAILYGGSVKPGNAADLLAVAHVGGALVGGASLKADDFWAIARSCAA